MKIYTKGGDQGETGLFGGSRVPKDHHRIEVYGILDELSAALGVALASTSNLPKELKVSLLRIQNELFTLGSELATPSEKKLPIDPISDEATERLENEIDQWTEQLPELKTFILPGGAPLAAHLHLARTICRRAERALIGLGRLEPIRGEVFRYVNRLSDHLFVAARYANLQSKTTETPWIHT